MTLFFIFLLSALLVTAYILLPVFNVDPYSRSIED